MYACLIKNSDGTWDVHNMIPGYPQKPEKHEIFLAGINSGLPITGMKTTEYQPYATVGATWDGTSFSGGTKAIQPDEFDWSTVETYAYICNNKIIQAGIILKDVGSQSIIKNDIIFDEENELNIIEIPEGTTVKVGDIWDGENFITV
jgi:hypothetical protein